MVDEQAAKVDSFLARIAWYLMFDEHSVQASLQVMKYTLLKEQLKPWIFPHCFRRKTGAYLS